MFCYIVDHNGAVFFFFKGSPLIENTYTLDNKKTKS